MDRVQMMVMGKMAEVDADMVKKMIKKDELMANALRLQQDRKLNPVSAYDAMMAADKITMQIIRLNRTIRKTVRFL
jgi:hypothetical protein